MYIYIYSKRENSIYIYIVYDQNIFFLSFLMDPIVFSIQINRNGCIS